MKPLIIANWKMNFDIHEAISFTKQLSHRQFSNKLIIAVPALFSSYLSMNFKNLDFALQNISSYKNYGPYTGEYSARMARSCDINYSLIGHSERRLYFLEDNNIIKTKATNCIAENITPIICIGETIELRRNNQYKEFLIDQLSQSLPDGIINDLIIAYEPVWAIGSGITPTEDEIEEIFSLLKLFCNSTIVAKKTCIVYGGSVNQKNYRQILSIPNVNGLLIGGASLKINELITILN